MSKSPAYLMFVGNIDQQGVKRLVDALTLSTAGTGAVHLALQSAGGFVSDGIALYEAFQRLPVDLTVYNIGGVLSIAAIAFLGAPKRKATEHAAFMLHRSQLQLSKPVQAEGLKAMANGALIEDARTEAILRSHLQLTDLQWGIHHRDDLWLSAYDALAAGVIDEIAPFAPPLGQQVFSI